MVGVKGGEDKFFDSEERAIYSRTVDVPNEVIIETYYQYELRCAMQHAMSIEEIKKYKDKNIQEALLHPAGNWYRKDVEYDRKSDNFYFVERQSQESEGREQQHSPWSIYNVCMYIKQKILGF